MSYSIQYASINTKGILLWRTSNARTLSALAKEIKGQMQKGSKSFLLGPPGDRKTVKAVASMVADLKMAQLETDFHFAGLLRRS